MKIVKGIVLGLLCFVVAHVDAFTWQFFNETEEVMVIKIKLLASSREFFSVIEPGNSGTITPEEQDKVMEGFCLGVIEYAQRGSGIEPKDHVFMESVSIQLPLCQSADFVITKLDEKVNIERK